MHIAAADALPSGPVRLAVDACPAKGQRSTSTYQYSAFHRAMCRLISTSPLRKTISVHTENGYRSSRQAAGLQSYLADLPRADHRTVKLTDVQQPWQSAAVGDFGHFYCPVTAKIVRRDPPAATSLVAIGTCTLHKAPHHINFCPNGTKVT